MDRCWARLDSHTNSQFAGTRVELSRHDLTRLVDHGIVVGVVGVVCVSGTLSSVRDVRRGSAE